MSPFLTAFAYQVLRLVLWLLILGAIFLPLERWFAVRSGQAPRAQRWQDVGLYFVSSLVPMLVLATPLAMLAQLSRQLLPEALPATMAGLPLPGRFALAFLIGELGFYWGHRAAHSWPWLWRFHAVHHSPRHLYFLVNTRVHPVDMVFTRLCGLLPLYVLGLAGPSAGGSGLPVAVILVGTLWGFFIHSNIRVRLGPLEWLLSTPAFHHWHHTRQAPLDRNFASMLPLVDRLFGTHHLPREWPAEYGIDHESIDRAKT